MAEKIISINVAEAKNRVTGFAKDQSTRLKSSLSERAQQASDAVKNQRNKVAVKVLDGGIFIAEKQKDLLKNWREKLSPKN